MRVGKSMMTGRGCVDKYELFKLPLNLPAMNPIAGGHQISNLEDAVTRRNVLARRSSTRPPRLQQRHPTGMNIDMAI